MNIETLTWIVYGAPLIGVLAIALTGSKLRPAQAGVLACLMMVISFAAAAATLMTWQGLSDKSSAVVSEGWTWLSSGTFKVPFELYIDPLSIWMLLIVTGVGLLIHIYSLGYMKHDAQKRRFMAYLNLFVFSMLTLVLAGNLVMLLIGWGLVGMASYLLIGFWHDRSTATAAGKKAFIMNAIGDIGIMLGLYLVFRETGALSFGQVFTELPNAIAANSMTAFMICLLISIGAFAKSAQLPLQTWLPDAMEGPTPVSALIHAATMVTAGVYAIARLHPVYDLSLQAQQMIIIIGGVTLVLAGFTALAQTDIKRVIAYSTMSQIGYMFVAVGVGAYSAAMFHLGTHAFFKALLFLGAGVVIHALADEQDIRKMGGLKRYMPKTYALFLIGSLALAGIFPLAGFFSKDEILAFALAAGDHYGAWAYTVYGLTLIGVVLTGLYSFRLMFVVFHGKESPLVEQYGKGQIMHHGEPTNKTGEAPASMFWPVAILGVFTIISGLIAIPGMWNIPHDFLTEAGAAPTRAAVAVAEFAAPQAWLLALVISLPLAVIGIGAAFMIWERAKWSALRSKMPRAERVFQAAFGFDALYDRSISHVAREGAELIATIERGLSEPFIDEVVIAGKQSGRALGKWQTGVVRMYSLATVLGFVLLMVVFLIMEG